MCDKEEKVEQKSDQVPVPLGPYQPYNPVGIDYIVQRTGSSASSVRSSTPMKNC
uniref:Uncharacterized protein n=1 Tax=Anguilla anguilla TaxID=7936 RepID=A0A0E9R0N5_ANGAN